MGLPMMQLLLPLVATLAVSVGLSSGRREVKMPSDESIQAAKELLDQHPVFDG